MSDEYVNGPGKPGPNGCSHEEITKLAYHLWEDRGRQEGSPDQDWLRAELELARSRTANEVAVPDADQPHETLDRIFREMAG